MRLLQRKTAIVTGGTAGIGSANAKRFAEHGAFGVIMGTIENAERRSLSKSVIARCFRSIILCSQRGNTQEIEQAIKSILAERGNIHSRQQCRHYTRSAADENERAGLGRCHGYQCQVLL